MWSRKYNKCVKCGTTEEKHLSRGLCVKCYHKDIEGRHKKKERQRGIAARKLTKKYIVDQYFKENKSLSDIAKGCSCSRQFVYKKMLDIKFPQIPPQSVRHFIRGCWDGDGSVYFTRHKLRYFRILRF